MFFAEDPRPRPANFQPVDSTNRDRIKSPRKGMAWLASVSMSSSGAWPRVASFPNWKLANCSPVIPTQIVPRLPSSWRVSWWLARNSPTTGPANLGNGKSLVLGNYVILDKLGQGGMGLVLKAEHRRMERLVALKIFSPAITKSPDAMRRFGQEVKVAARLTHPNIATAYDADIAGNTHFLVMEYVEGRDLASLTTDQGQLPLAVAIEFVRRRRKDSPTPILKGSCIATSNRPICCSTLKEPSRFSIWDWPASTMRAVDGTIQWVTLWGLSITWRPNRL